MEPTADNGAPASTSGPASSAAPSSGGISHGTASEALIKAASAASSAAATPDGASGDTLKPAVTGTDGAVAATKGPRVAEGQVDTTTNRGSVPTANHEAAVKNARTKGIQEGEAKYAWAKGIPAAAVKDIPLGLQTMQALRGPDKVAFITDLASQFGLIVVPKGQQKSASTVETSFEPDLETQDGKVKAFSAGRVQELLSHAIDQLRSEMRGEISPLVEDRRTAQEKAAEDGRKEQARTTSANTLTRMRAMQGFKENEAEIAQRLRDLPLETKQEMGAIGALYHVYNEVLNERLPSLEAQAEQRVREANSKKAAASRGAHPVDAGGSGGATPELRGPGDLAKHMQKLAGVSA